MLGDDVKDSALEEMIGAGTEERQLAIDSNILDTDDNYLKKYIVLIK